MAGVHSARQTYGHAYVKCVAGVWHGASRVLGAGFLAQSWLCKHAACCLELGPWDMLHVLAVGNHTGLHHTKVVLACQRDASMLHVTMLA